MNYCKNVRTYTLHLKPIIFEHSANHDQWDGPLASHDQAVHNEDNDKVSDSHAHPDIEQQHDVLDIRCVSIIHSQTLIFCLHHEYISYGSHPDLHTCFINSVLIVSTVIVVLFIDIFDLTISELVTGHLVRHPGQSSSIAGRGRLN